MEDTLKRQQPCVSTSTSSSSPPPLAIHKDSQTIAKVKPKIRIIHIFAPEIIKTDVANFRELVQRLTGKPTDHHPQKGCKKKPRIPRRDQENPRNCDKNKVEQRNNGFGVLGAKERLVKEEVEEMWSGANSGGGFLGGFADLDGFIQELGDFPMLPGDANRLQYMFDESQLA